MDDTNLEERIYCPCNGCKHQILRKRRICLQHVCKYGTFPREALENLSSQEHGQQSHVDIAPTMSRAGRKRPRVTDETPPENSLGLEEDPIEEMMDAFFEMDPHILEDEQDHGSHEEKAAAVRDTPESMAEKTMRSLARLPLYKDARISVLRACLAMLNLQSIYGWSDTSVTKLFK